MSVRSANLKTSFRKRTDIVNCDILIIDFESSSTSSQHCWSESFSWLQQQASTNVVEDPELLLARLQLILFKIRTSPEFKRDVISTSPVS